MKALVTRVGIYVTGDALADAVLSYSLALARDGLLDMVDVPFRAAGGEVGRVQLRVGWMTDMDATSQGRNGGELRDDIVVEDLRAREAALSSDGSSPLSEDDVLVDQGDY